MMYNWLPMKMVKRYPLSTGWITLMGLLAYVLRPGFHFLSTSIVH